MNNKIDLNSLGAQVDSSLYVSSGYCTPARFAMYAYQIKQVLKSKANTVLEIGPGNGVVTYLLRQAGLRVDTMDHDPDLGPDIVASALCMPFPDDSYDLVLCCQVLEHLPWEAFGTALHEISRIARHNAVISLPHRSRHLYAEFKLPLFGVRTISIDIPVKAPMEFNGEHYWEIGRGVTESDVVSAFRQVGLSVEDSYRPREHRYHHFFALSRS